MMLLLGIGTFFCCRCQKKDFRYRIRSLHHGQCNKVFCDKQNADLMWLSINFKHAYTGLNQAVQLLILTLAILQKSTFFILLAHTRQLPLNHRMLGDTCRDQFQIFRSMPAPTSYRFSENSYEQHHVKLCSYGRYSGYKIGITLFTTMYVGALYLNTYSLDVVLYTVFVNHCNTIAPSTLYEEGRLFSPVEQPSASVPYLKIQKGTTKTT